jgi:predicted NBD/HSP70 family sugar kinase
MGLDGLRRHHLSLVLDRLARQGPRSRAALAKETGLTKASVSSLVTDLLDRGLVEARAVQRNGRKGRPATDVAVSGSTVAGIGLEIAVDNVAACLVDLTGARRSLHRVAGDNGDARPAVVLDRLADAARHVLGAADEAGLLCVGGGLAVPGLVVGSSVLVAPNLGWTDVDLGATSLDVGLPEGAGAGDLAGPEADHAAPAGGRLAVGARRAPGIVVENEANLGALAEWRHGAGRGLSSFVYVSGGIGVGAGVVHEGRLTRGSHGFAGEIGHVIVDPGGRRCACGARGCLETVAGTGRPATRAGHTAVADALAVALRSVVHVLDPQAVVLGGSFAAAGPDLAAAVADRLRTATLGAPWSPCEVRTSTLGVDAALVGGATAALDAVIADPTTVPPRSVAADPATVPTAHPAHPADQPA